MAAPMATTTPATTSGPIGTTNNNIAPMPWSAKTTRSSRGFRVAMAAGVLYFLGTITWLIGAALLTASQGRYNLSPNPLAVLPTLDGPNFVGFKVCIIISAAIWFIASLVGLSAIYAETEVFRTSLALKQVPLLGRYAVIGAWWAVLAQILLIIGAAVFCGATPAATSTGAIIMMIGFTLWLLGQSHQLMVSLATQSMVPLMMDLGLRYRAWHGAMVDLGVFVALIFYALGSILLVLQQPPGSWLGAGLLYLVGSFVGLISYWMAITTTWNVAVPILPYLLATYPQYNQVPGTSTTNTVTTTAMTENPMGAPAGATVPATAV